MLNDYYLTFKAKVNTLFKEQFEGIIDELELLNLYQDLNEMIETPWDLEGEVYLIEELGAKKFVRIGELDPEVYHDYLLLAPFEGKHPYSTVEFGDESSVYSLQINDHYRHLHWIVTFNQDLTRITIENWFLKENELVVDWTKDDCQGDPKEYHYLLNLLSWIGDYLYDFETE